MAKVLVTGANGFVGKRLIYSLLDQGHEVFALCRIEGRPSFAKDLPKLHYLWGDVRNPNTKKIIPKDLDVAYYLIHSMSDKPEHLEESESFAAKQFLNCIDETSIQQIIYLTGIINDEKNLSDHLSARLGVEKTLSSGKFPTTILRASIIIGAGSASFEIIRDLCEKLPFMIAPKWLIKPCQPIAIQDVLFYLTHVLLHKECFNQVFDIGGPEILTFRDLLLEYSAFRKLKRFVWNVPILTPHFSSYWLVFITSVRFSICYYLVESIKHSSVVKLDGLNTLIPHKCLTFKKSLELVFQNIDQNEVMSSWMDAWKIGGMDVKIQNYIEVPKDGCVTDTQRFLVRDSSQAALDRIWKIGGTNGYYALNWAWRLRGFIDRLIGGVGLNRGRRHPTEIQVGDSIDFWRVLRADREKMDLILFSGMKLPGDAWLEFRIEQTRKGPQVTQRATFRPKGLLGRLYWYALLPFHFLIFRKMAKTVAGSK
jgi:uncharacterized protein YbjT (DUF2867 family)